jgi:cytoplasmic iron level regulating protein YaaA (DUF328/UPF0246 family)
MKIIISPAKKMREDPDAFPITDMPQFLDQAQVLLKELRGYTYEELKKLLACNDQLTGLNFRRYETMDLRKNLTPALFAYKGIQYQYMAPEVFTDDQYEYLQAHLRILSGFYGLLRPLDGIVSYRLEMQAKPAFCGSLYDFWGRSLGEELSRDNDLIINLASKEYSRCVQMGLSTEVRWVTVYFGEVIGGKFKEKGTQCKMARGAMVRYMAENQVETVDGLLEFSGLGYRFDPARSTEQDLYFLKS